MEKDNQEGFIERIFAKFNFRNENSNQLNVIMDNLNENKNGNENETKNDINKIDNEENMDTNNLNENDINKNETNNEEIEPVKNNKKQNPGIKLQKNTTQRDIEYLSKQLEKFIIYIYRLPKFNYLFGGKYLRKHEKEFNKNLKQLEYLYKEVEFTRKSLVRLKKSKCAIRAEKRLIKNNLDYLRNATISILENIVSANDANLYKKWEELKKSNNAMELNKFLNDIKSREMVLDTMSRLVRRRIFLLQSSAAIKGEDSIGSIKSQKSNEFIIEPTLTTTVSTSPLNSRTNSKRNMIMANLRKRRLLQNASSSGIKLRPITGEHEHFLTPTSSIQVTNKHSSNNSMFVAVSNNTDSSVSLIGPQFPINSRISLHKQSVSLLKANQPPLHSLVDNDLLIFRQNSNTSQSTNETLSDFSYFTPSNFQADVRSVLKTLFGKEASDLLLQDDDDDEEEDEDDIDGMNSQQNMNEANNLRRNLTIHDIEFDKIQTNTHNNPSN